MADTDLTWALDEFRRDRRLTRYELARSYYLGDHRMAFATEKFRSTFGALFQALADNLCPAVVDALTDRLKVTGFNGSSGSTRLARKAWDIWQRNRMDLIAPEVHREAVMTGDGFVIVWPDRLGRARIVSQMAHEMAVDYQAGDDRPGTIRRAAKMWRDDDGRMRVTLYFRDRVERYRSRTTWKLSAPGPKVTAKSFLPYPVGTISDSTFLPENVVPNPHGVVPVFHFPNKFVHRYGLSDLLDVIPLQDALNKSICDMIVAAEFTAFPQRWVTGMEEVEVDEATGQPKDPPWNLGVERLLIGTDPEMRFGQFPQADFRQFLEKQESLRAEIARVSGTPLHYLFLGGAGGFPSGEALKSSEARFTRRVEGRQESWGDGWEDVHLLAARMEGQAVPDREDDRPIETVWSAASPRSEREQLETALMKRKVGVSRQKILQELGYTDDEIKTMLEEDPAPPAAAEQAAGELGDDIGGEQTFLATSTGRERIPNPAARRGVPGERGQ